MKKEDEKLIAELIKKYKISEKNTEDEDVRFVMKAIAFVLKVEANREKNKLSIQETLCLMLLSSGENPDKCADLLGISAKTVTTYEQRYRKKLGAKNRA